MHLPNMLQRFGFTYEGLFRQSNICKGRNRDTALVLIVDSEWPDVKARFEHWLELSNFDQRDNKLNI